MLYDPKWEEKLTADWRSMLLKAAEIVRQRGLAKFTQQDKEGRVCVQGAISIAITGKPFCSSYHEEYCEITRILARYLQDKGEVGAKESGNAYWNNAPHRTAEQVIAALEDCARA
jgi:hypothetical protein